MNYFELYPGDYLRDTSRLSLLEHGIYLKLMLSYYGDEAPLPAEFSAIFSIISATNSDEKKATRAVVEKFFPIDPKDGLRHNKRADEEIAKALKRIETSRKNGAKGGRKANPTTNPPSIPKETQRDTQQGGQQGTCSGEASPHATRHTPEPSIPSGSEVVTEIPKGLNTHRADACATPPDESTAVAACKAMLRAGLTTANPSHPALLALLPHASPAQFGQAAATAVNRGKGFNYALGVLKGQIADAAAPPKPRQGDAETLYATNRAVAAEWLAEGAPQ